MTSMGRLTLNILLSFAQFEREIISERTRDKIAAARRKGKFSGGKPLLGYDIVSSPAGAKLVVNEDESHIVRSIFGFYLEHQALIPVVTELARRGWCNKRWTMRNGETTGGRPFDKTTLFRLLTNRTYTGVVAYGGETYAGEHLGIAVPEQFNQMRAILAVQKLRDNRTLTVLSEEQFLAALDLDQHRESVHRVYTRPTLCELLGIAPGPRPRVG
jgi:site-specific DNA recombinase